MTLKKTDLITASIFALLLNGTLITYTQLKILPQIQMLILSLFTLLAFFSKNQTLPTILFYTLLTIMLYINYFMLTTWLIDMIYPDRGWVDIDGEKRKIMDMSWLWSVLVGFVFSVITLYVYHTANVRNRALEILMATIFILIAVLIFP